MKNVIAKWCLLPMVCSFVPVPEDEWLDRKSNPTVWFYPELKCKGLGSLGEAASHPTLLSIAVITVQLEFTVVPPLWIWANSAWNIICQGSEAQQPGLHHSHLCCFSSGQCKGFSCQICLTHHRLSFPRSILICNHVLSSLENAEQ